MPGEISALISLLDDDSRKVLSAVSDRFVDLGEDAVPALVEALDDPSAKVRTRAREILARVRRRQAFADAFAFAEFGDGDLEEGALVLSRIHTPDLDTGRVSERLDELAELLRPSVALAEPGRERLQTFLDNVHDVLGFTGDVDDFFCYENNFLHTVLERRRGIPITLIAIYVLLGRRLDLDIRAVGAPYRALAHYAWEDFETWIDAFDDGELWSFDDTCAFLQRQGIHGPRWNRYLPELDDLGVLERMTQNLVSHCDSKGRIPERDLFRELASKLAARRPGDVRYFVRGESQ